MENVHLTTYIQTEDTHETESKKKMKRCHSDNNYDWVREDRYDSVQIQVGLQQVRAPLVLFYNRSCIQNASNKAQIAWKSI